MRLQSYILLITFSVSIYTFISYSPSLNQLSNYIVSNSYVGNVRNILDLRNATLVERNKTCNIQIALPVFNESHSEKLQVFFLETSGRSYLKGRQVCSVESAAVKSGLISKVILRSSHLDLSISKSLCDLYYGYGNIEFYTMDYLELFRNTPVEGITNKIDSVVDYGITHYSDIGRIALIYKYGGFYLDLDLIVTKSLLQFSNFYVIESGKKKPGRNCYIPSGAQNGHWLSNGQFHFYPGHEFLWTFMQHVNNSYKTQLSDRHQAGPKVAWAVAKKMYNLTRLTNQELEPKVANRHMKILPDFTFLPVDFPQIGPRLYPGTPRTPDQWDYMFKCSYTVHFYSNKWGHKNVTGDPKLDAYSYLGPTNCPLSFKHYKKEF